MGSEEELSQLARTLGYVNFGLLVVGIVVFIYALYTLRKRADRQYFIKRGIRWLHLIVICCALFVFIVAPLETLGFAFKVFSIKFQTTLLLNGELIIFTAIMLAIKFGAQYVNVKVQQESRDWRDAMDANTNLGWVLRWQMKLHAKNISIYVVLVAIGIVVFILYSIIFLGLLYSLGNLMGFACLITEIATVGCVMLWITCKVANFVDIWYIRDEMLLVVSVLTVSAVSMVVGLIVIAGTNGDALDNMSEAFGALINQVSLICINTVAISLPAVSIIVVERRNESRNHRLQEYLQQNKEGEIDFDRLISFLTSDDGAAFEVFMHFLEKEFSKENLLYLCELVHLQKFMIKFGYLDLEEEEPITRMVLPAKLKAKPYKIQQQTDTLKAKKKRRMFPRTISGAPNTPQTHLSSNASSSVRDTPPLTITAIVPTNSSKTTPSMGGITPIQTEKNAATYIELKTVVDSPENTPNPDSHTPNTESKPKDSGVPAPLHLGDEEMRSQSAEDDSGYTPNKDDKSSTGGVKFSDKTVEIEIEHRAVMTPRRGSISEMFVNDGEAAEKFEMVYPVFESLYGKYLVRRVGMMEVNISGQCSRDLESDYNKWTMGIMNDLLWESWLTHMQHSANEVQRLVLNSFRRFESYRIAQLFENL